MTQSDNIVEFLKYASPRLDYIEHCMEKQALSPTRALQAVKAFRARSSQGLIDPAKYKRLGALSDSVGKLRGKEKNQLKNVAGKLHKKYYDGKYVKGDYSRVQQRAAAPNWVDDYFAQYGRMPDQFDAPVVPAAKPKVSPNQFNWASGSNAVNFGGGTPSSPVSLAAGDDFLKIAPNAGKVPAEAAKEVAEAASEPGMWNNITAWMKEHPYLTVGGGVAAGAAGGAGLGYGIGNGSGRQEGSQIAQRYYELREALDRQRLQRANDSFLSRLGNLFGTGDLSGLIG